MGNRHHSSVSSPAQRDIEYLDHPTEKKQRNTSLAITKDDGDFFELFTGAFKSDNGDSFIYAGGKLHSVMDQPAYATPGNLHQRWFKHGLEHRDNSPSFLVETPVSRMARWSQFDKAHRVDGPAVITANRRFVTFEYQRHGQLHNSYGPAFVQWIYNAECRKVQMVAEEYYIDGKQVKAEDVWAAHRANGIDLEKERRRVDRLVKIGCDFWEIVQELFSRHWIA
jgi:hypothetical protein